MCDKHTSPERKEALSNLLFDIVNDIIDIHGSYYMVSYHSVDAEARENFYIGPIDGHAELIRFLQSDKAPYSIDHGYMKIFSIEPQRGMIFIPNKRYQDSNDNLYKVNFSTNECVEDTYKGCGSDREVYTDYKKGRTINRSILVHALGFDDAVDLASLYFEIAFEPYEEVKDNIVYSRDGFRSKYLHHKTYYEWSVESVEIIKNITLIPAIDFESLTKDFPQ